VDGDHLFVISTLSLSLSLSHSHHTHSYIYMIRLQERQKANVLELLTFKRHSRELCTKGERERIDESHSVIFEPLNNKHKTLFTTTPHCSLSLTLPPTNSHLAVSLFGFLLSLPIISILC
jgi:hypothetical protein